MYAQPDYPAALSSLQGMTSDQLKEILNRYQLKSLISTDVYP